MILLKENPRTNIKKLRKKEVIFDIFISKNCETCDDAIRMYNQLKSCGLITEYDDENEIEFAKDLEKSESAHYVDRNKNFESDMVDQIDAILKSRGEHKNIENEQRIISDKDLQEMVQRSAGIRKVGLRV